MSGCFLPSAPRLHTESVFSSCWMVKFITSFPSRFGDLPSVFSLTCWGFTKTLVLSKAWHLGPTWGRHRIFIAFLPFSFLWALSLPLPQQGRRVRLLPHSAGPQNHALSVTVMAAILVVIYLHKLPDHSG